MCCSSFFTRQDDTECFSALIKYYVFGDFPILTVIVSAGSRYPCKPGHCRGAHGGLFTKVWAGYIGDTGERIPGINACHIRAGGGKGTVWSQGPRGSSCVYEGQLSFIAHTQ